MTNGLSIDIEEYFQVEAASGVIGAGAWDRWPSRVEWGTRRVLDLLAEGRSRATFFALGWVAERHPALIRSITEAGHEVACHGYAHEHIARQTPDRFRADLRRARSLLEDITGGPIVGYRAPTFSIRAGTFWALDVLVAEGFQYDSSIFPVHHDRYGVPRAPRWPYVIGRAGGRIVELPPLTVRLGAVNLAVAGGGYLRVLPASAVAWAVRQMNRRGSPAVIYLHPWEVDAAQPRLPLGRLSAWRHRVGLRSTAGKLRRLLRAGRFGPLAPIAQNVMAAGGKTST